MSHKKQEADREPSIADDMPSAPVRSAVSFLLFVHLFCVAMALAGIFAPSRLQERLADAVSPYSQFFGFDLNGQFYYAPYHLTGGIEMDDDHLIEVEWSNAQGEPQVLQLSKNSLRGTCAHQRRQLLGKFISDMTAQQADGAIDPLAKMLTVRTLKDHDATLGTFRVRRHMSVDFESEEERPDPFDPEMYTTTYEARIELTDDGKVLLFRQAEETQVAVPDP